MSKAIYVMKLALLETQFKMIEVETTQVRKMAEYIGLFYGDTFIKAPLSSAAAFNDLKFMTQMQQYSHLQPAISQAALASSLRHLWYLTAQLLVPMCFVDDKMDKHTQKQLAKEIYKMEKPQRYLPNKPEFPQFPTSDSGEVQYKIGDFLITDQSWILLHLLGIENKSEWLNEEKSKWESDDGVQKLKLFVENVHVTNDLAERGVELMSDFIHKTENEDERQALLQVVEFHRAQFPNLKKETLKKLKC